MVGAAAVVVVVGSTRFPTNWYAVKVWRAFIVVVVVACLPAYL